MQSGKSVLLITLQRRARLPINMKHKKYYNLHIHTYIIAGWQKLMSSSSRKQIGSEAHLNNCLRICRRTSAHVCPAGQFVVECRPGFGHSFLPRMSRSLGHSVPPLLVSVWQLWKWANFWVVIRVNNKQTQAEPHTYTNTHVHVKDIWREANWTERNGTEINKEETGSRGGGCSWEPTKLRFIYL